MSSALNIADVAAEQWGLVTTAQARHAGVSAQAVARFANEGALERITHGIYRLTGAPASPLDSLRAAWLALDPGRRASERLRDDMLAVVSYRSAAAIHRLGDLEADEHEFTISQRKQTRRPDVRLHRGEVRPADRTVVDGLPVTTVIRTVDDLAAARIDGGHLASVVRDALLRRQVDDRALESVLRRHAHHYGAPLGDGAALLAWFLQEAGVPESIERAVTRTRPDVSAQTWTPQQLAETVVALQRAMAPAHLAAEEALGSPGMRAALDQVRAVLHSPALRRAAEAGQQVANSPAMRSFVEAAEQTRTALDSSGVRSAAENAQRVANSPAVRSALRNAARMQASARSSAERRGRP